MSDIAQIIDANGVSYVTAANPFPVIVVTPSGGQPAFWGSDTTISTATPLPVVAS